VLDSTRSSSQVWKVFRIGTLGHQTEDDVDAKGLLSDNIEVINESLDERPNGFKCGNYVRNSDNFTSLGVELSACLGGWCFFVGTLMYNFLPGPWFHVCLWIWEAGSVWFTMGSLFLGYRHFVMGL
jgi:hypothetical protein